MLRTENENLAHRNTREYYCHWEVRRNHAAFTVDRRSALDGALSKEPDQVADKRGRMENTTPVPAPWPPPLTGLPRIAPIPPNATQGFPVPTLSVPIPHNLASAHAGGVYAAVSHSLTAMEVRDGVRNEDKNGGELAANVRTTHGVHGSRVERVRRSG